MSDWYDVLDDLINSAHDALDADGAIEQAKMTDQVVQDACDAISRRSEAGEIDDRHVNQLAGELSDIFPNLTKTDLRGEFRDHFVDDPGDGTPFNQVIEDRLASIQIIRTTDKKQDPIFRYEFVDPEVEIEDDSESDGHLHYSWQNWRQQYFDALLAVGAGEAIADPADGLADNDDWKEWIDEQFLLGGEIVETQEHVGPRTQAVRQLRDWVGRQVAYSDIEDAVERQGVLMQGVDTGTELDDLDTSTVVHVPVEVIERICDQVGVSSRGLQIELDARGVTSPDISGVSDPQYVNGQRKPYWAVTLALAEPRDLVHDPDTPAAQIRDEKEAEQLADQTDIGAVESDDVAAAFAWLFEGGPATDGVAPVGDHTKDNGDESSTGLLDSIGGDVEEVSDDD